MNTILVTGGGGYIGSVLIPKLLQKGYQVKALDRFFFGQERLPVHPRLEILKEDSRRITKAMLANVDAVIDLVAVSNDPSGELFTEATYQINYHSRVRTATLAKEVGVQRYILPSSCSIYGFQSSVVDETAKTNPLTTYAKANEQAEKAVFSLADESFVVTIMRQATIFGASPKMRFDLAINGMVYGAWTTKKLPLMRDGKQYRPMLHIQDTTDVMLQLLTEPAHKINGQIFNIGGNKLNYQLAELGDIIAKAVGHVLGEEVRIEWYGDVDNRSYQVDFTKIKRELGWEPQWDALKGVSEMVAYLQQGQLDKTTETITLEWYKQLEKWHRIIRETEMYGGILTIS